MIIKRIGNDVYIECDLRNDDGTPFDPSNANMRVELRNPFAATVKVKNYSFEGSIIKFWVLASELKNVGSYDFWMEVKRPNADIPSGVATYTFDIRGLIKIEWHTREK